MLTAILLPGLSLLRHRRKRQGFFFLLLQPTLIGWIIGSYIAVQNLKHQRRRRRHHLAPMGSSAC